MNVTDALKDGLPATRPDFVGAYMRIEGITIHLDYLPDFHPSNRHNLESWIKEGMIRDSPIQWLSWEDIFADDWYHPEIPKVPA